MRRLLCSIVMLPLLWALPAQAEQDFLPPEQAFQLSVTRQADGQVGLRWIISPGYYLYRDQMKLQGDAAGSALPAAWPAGTLKTDETYGESEVYHDQVGVSLRPGNNQTLTIGWQGCADAGLCYPPQSRRVNLADIAAPPAAATGLNLAAGTGASLVPGLGLPAAGVNWSQASVAGQTNIAAAAPSAPVAPSVAGALGEDQALAERLSRISLGWMLLVFFGMGLLLTFTPCVLPMLPILSSLIAGSGAGLRRGFVLSLAFVLPMALAYAAIGAAAALAGANLQAVLQNPWVLGAFGLIFVVLALAMFGFYELQLPAVLRNRLNQASASQRGGTVLGAASMGVLSALLVVPTA